MKPKHICENQPETLVFIPNLTQLFWKREDLSVSFISENTTLWQGSSNFLLLVRSKTSWKWAENDPCFWSLIISWRKRSFSEMSVFSLFSRRKQHVWWWVKYEGWREGSWFFLYIYPFSMHVIFTMLRGGGGVTVKHRFSCQIPSPPLLSYHAIWFWMTRDSFQIYCLSCRL